MVMFPHLLDLRHLKHAEPAKDVEKYDGRVVLHWNNVQDDNGYKAVFVERNASVSHVAAARFLDIISRHRIASQDCEDCLSKNTHKCGHDSHPVEDRKVRIQMEEPVVSHERKLYGHPWAGLLLVKTVGGSTSKAQFGKQYHLGNVFTSIEHHNCSCPHTWQSEKPGTDGKTSTWKNELLC